MNMNTVKEVSERLGAGETGLSCVLGKLVFLSIQIRRANS
jgi:hypothetical protein